ncbi:MAG TPA: pilus assembly protein TadG-related protein [Azospirillaceae bacterium]|nr:pilus assembly protein TadG-related protein [Azospirillaceae bacterium]
MTCPNRTADLPSSFLRLARRLAGDRQGASMVAFAVSLPMLAGGVGMGVETGLWYMTKRQAQTAADAAALSGALELRRGDDTAIRAAAAREATRNGFQAGTSAMGTTGVATARVTLAGGRQGVEVVVTRQTRLLFSSLFLTAPVSIAARAVAAVENGGDACVLALDRSASGALTITGSTQVSMAGCVLASNSAANGALSVGGSASLGAEGLWTVGTIAGADSPKVSLTGGDSARVQRAWPLPDPYAHLDLSAPAGCTRNSKLNVNGPQTISPGTYCNDIQVVSNGVLTLRPGVYHLKNASLTVGGQGTVRCDCLPGQGVTIILTGTSPGTVDIRGGASVVLSAPSAATDPYRGVIFAQSRQAAVGGDNKFNGGSGMVLQGAVYFPNQSVDWLGNDTSNLLGCAKIIGRTVTFSGNSRLANAGCAALGTEPMQTRSARLVE